MIKITHLDIFYDKEILEDVMFEAYCGNVTLIKGESGSGKTTLLYRIALLSLQNDFNYYFGNKQLNLKNIEDVSLFRKKIAFVLQDSQVVSYYSIKENLEYFCEINNQKCSLDIINKNLKLVNLNVDMNQSASLLSLGERQRLAIACALVKETPVIVLDEPTASLDEENELNIFQLLDDISKKENKCIIVSSHSKHALKHADCIYEISNKKLICTKADVYNNDICENSKSVNKNLSFNHLLKYVKHYIKFYKKAFFNQLLIVVVSMIMVIVFLLYIGTYKNNNKNEIQSYSHNQMYISLNDGNVLVDENAQPFNINDLKLQDIKANIYPFIDTSFVLLDKKIAILPYFFDDEYKMAIHEYGNQYADEHIYISYSLSQLLKRNQLTVRNINIDLTITQENKTKKKENLVFEIYGILDEGVKSKYLDNSLVMYVPYNMLKSIYQKMYNGNNYIGYTLLFKDYLDYKDAKEYLQTNPLIEINDSFQNDESIDYIIEGIDFITVVISIFLVVVSIINLCFKFIHYISQRKKEFVILLISGMTYKDIIRIIMIEQGLMILSSALISLICILLFSIFYGKMIKISLLLNLGYSIIIFICSFILGKMQVNRMTVENVLRS